MPGPLTANHLGTLSVCLTYPLELIRVRLAFITRSYGNNNNNTNHTRARPLLRKAISDIYHENSQFRPPPLSSMATSDATTPSTSPAKSLRAHLFYRFPLLSFYRGFTVTLMGMIPYAGTSFLTWGYLRSVVLPTPIPGSLQKPKPTPIADLTIGALSGSIAQTVSYPFEVIRRRMQVGGLTNPDPNAWLTLSEVIKEIWRTNGWRGFYVGLGIGYLKVVPMTATSFAVWQWGKRLLDV